MPKAGGGDRTQRRLAGVARRAGNRENRQHTVTDELQHLAPEKRRTAPATRSNQASRAAIIAVGSVASDRAVKSRRSAQSSAARMVSPVPRRSAPACTWARAAPAEIGLEQRCQRRLCGQGTQGRCGEARGLAQPAGFGGTEWPGPGPAQHRAVRRRADRVLLHRPKPG